ncbi:bacteriophage abortive infection AbiH family protein [Phocaeicola vulgatus]|uniref:bacteriophage abortive infection AbiH family protein n=1 Tax=Phocaeicola vulgatus TaxID=821 RepID=UPI00189D45A5|nr:bacteriophage abortive infection AbiH family protein [Phocaeicola vulgatus]
MHSLFPEFERIDQNTLFVIGNGVDLASGIKSSYYDFKQWLILNKRDQLINLMDIFFSNQREIWGDIEKALGEYDEDSILEFCKPDEEFDYDHPTRSVAAIEDSPDWIFRPVLDEFIEAFTEWVNSIDITVADKVLDLPSCSTYLTFNYTETLEKIYGIPQLNILHIHGSRLSENNYIIGHDNPRDTDEVYNDEGEYIFVQDTWSKIIAWMNEFVKDCEYIINANQDFFKGLSNIEQVVVYGHSFSEIDWPYMREIAKQIGKNKPWIISYHEDKDLIQIDSFIKAHELKKVTKFLW